MSVEQEPLKCPRCDSLDTKFCYYNNYSTTQPRHFCKNCKRYWTAGGSLRNVPVGGGLRKNKKSKQAKQAGGGISPSSNSAVEEQQQFHGGERGNRPLTRSASVTHNSLANPSSDGFSYESTSLPSLPLTSPSSSAEDETLAKSRSDPVFPYTSSVNLKYLDAPSDPYYANSYSNPLSLRSQADHHLYPPYNYALSMEASSLQQQQQADEIYGGFKRLRGGMGGDPSSSSSSLLQAQSGEISASSHELLGKSRIQYGYGGAMNQREIGVDGHQHQHQYQEQWYQQGLACPPPTSTSTTTTTTMVHGDLLQASTGEYPFEKRRGEEEDDEGLGNVVNVRYPYDWEQVSEVLFGGGPDFFQMPGF